MADGLRTGLAIVAGAAGLLIGYNLATPHQAQRDQYDLICVGTYDHQPLDIPGCDHETGRKR